MLHWLESSFSAWILSNMRCYINAELVDLHFKYGSEQGNTTTAQTMNMEQEGICLIAEHLSLFIEFCVRVDCFILRDAIFFLRSVRPGCVKCMPASFVLLWRCMLKSKSVWFITFLLITFPKIYDYVIGISADSQSPRRD